MRTHGSNVQREALLQADLSDVCDGLDVLGKTAWKINKEILEAGQRCWRDNIAIGDIPSRTDFEVPPELPRPSFQFDPPMSGEDPEYDRKMADIRSYRASVSKRQRIHQKNMVCAVDHCMLQFELELSHFCNSQDLRSLRCSAMLKLNQANRFKDLDRIYFPYNLDFRGRACK